jgi:hypothetical protein
MGLCSQKELARNLRVRCCPSVQSLRSLAANEKRRIEFHTYHIGKFTKEGRTVIHVGSVLRKVPSVFTCIAKARLPKVCCTSARAEPTRSSPIFYISSKHRCLSAKQFTYLLRFMASDPGLVDWSKGIHHVMLCNA